MTHEEAVLHAITTFASNRLVLEFDRNLCPTTNPGSIMMFGEAIANYLRTGDRAYLPPGVTAQAESMGEVRERLRQIAECDGHPWMYQRLAREALALLAE